MRAAWRIELVHSAAKLHGEAGKLEPPRPRRNTRARARRGRARLLRRGASGIPGTRLLRGIPPMSYLVLARKYRPQSFDDLIGQEHVSHDARATRSRRTASRTRSSSPASAASARPRARASSPRPQLPRRRRQADRPTPVPACAACTEIAAGVDMDVQEIDGASYNGVDEVRRLQESLAFRPARDRFKIYIVDEVHMLSNAAWNAFLKTLEEPPPHVKFIFATTEVHKVPVTILSRCQRYDFKLISAQTDRRRASSDVAREREASPPTTRAVDVLAREAAGSACATR